MRGTYTFICIFMLILSNFTANKAYAVQTAPRITDREIIESLASLKQSHIDLRQEIASRFNDVNNRFDDVNSRIDGLQYTMLSMFGAIIALIIGLFSYIAYDRRTMLKPLQDKVNNLEKAIHRDLDFQNEGGSLLTRLLNVMRDLAKTDKKIAEVLRSYSLM